MWKHTKDQMDSELLIDYVWPVTTGRQETVEEGDEFTCGWDEPLVGADIVGFCGQDDLPLAQTTAAVEKVEVDMEGLETVVLPSEISLDLVYDTLKELKDEVASNMLDSLIDGDGALDPMEDIDLDEFFREIQDGRGARLPSLPAPPVTVETKEEEETMRWLEEAPPLPLPHPPPADVVVVVEETRKCLPSPALSVDSGVSFASSEAPAVSCQWEHPAFMAGQAAADEPFQLLTQHEVAGFVAVGGEGAGSGPTEGAAPYETIDVNALLQLLDFESAAGEPPRDVAVGLTIETAAVGEDEIEGDLHPLASFSSSSSSSFSSSPSPFSSPSSSSFSSYSVESSPSPSSRVQHFHPYAQKPVDDERETATKTSKKRARTAKTAGLTTTELVKTEMTTATTRTTATTKKSESTLALRKVKKKEQNKTAATRYRLKKKMETKCVFQEEREEEKRNKELKSQVAALESEIEYLKNFMAEITRKRRRNANF